MLNNICKNILRILSLYTWPDSQCVNLGNCCSFKSGFVEKRHKIKSADNILTICYFPSTTIFSSFFPWRKTKVLQKREEEEKELRTLLKNKESPILYSQLVRGVNRLKCYVIVTSPGPAYSYVDNFGGTKLQKSVFFYCFCQKIFFSETKKISFENTKEKIFPQTQAWV